jgi:hypothetical protein
MADISKGVVVTEGMLTEAARAGDLESLTMWARQGVRVTSAEPLCVAVEAGFLEVLRCLVRELGADVNQQGQMGLTPLIVAAHWSTNLAVLSAWWWSSARTSTKETMMEGQICNRALSNPTPREDWSGGFRRRNRLARECSRRSL